MKIDTEIMAKNQEQKSEERLTVTMVLKMST